MIVDVFKSAGTAQKDRKWFKMSVKTEANSSVHNFKVVGETVQSWGFSSLWVFLYRLPYPIVGMGGWAMEENHGGLLYSGCFWVRVSLGVSVWSP